MSTSEGILASIFDGFWWIWGPNLGGKTDQKSIKKCIAKMMLNKMRLGGVLEASAGFLHSVPVVSRGIRGGVPPPAQVYM